MSDIKVRNAHERDVDELRGIFAAVYTQNYPFEGFDDRDWLLGAVYRDDIAMLVAEEVATGKLLGTASVVFDLGTASDLLGEFGRLAVHPEARGRGIGHQLMEGRCRFAAERIHVAIAQNRCVHPWSQQLSLRHGFVPVGFLPTKYTIDHRESVVLWARHFGRALDYRKNHPRIVPEVQGLATLSLEACGLADDAIVDESARAGLPGDDVLLEELTRRGMPALLRIERGRVRKREVFGPLQLNHGFFRISAQQATYILARHSRTNAVMGAIGFVHDPVNQGLQVSEVIARDASLQATLFRALLTRADEWDVKYLEVDVSAHAPELQRTLVDLGFVPAAYVPAMVFDQVERIDVVKFVRLEGVVDLGELVLLDPSRQVADEVVGRLANRAIWPALEAAMGDIALFRGLSTEQARRVATACTVREIVSGTVLVSPGMPADALYVPLGGRCTVRREGTVVGHVESGEALGEVALLLDESHGAEVTTEGAITVAVLSRVEFGRLVVQRPDIALQLYRNLARGLGAKLGRVRPS